MQKYTMVYKRISGSNYDTVRTADASVYTAVIEASNKKVAEKRLVEQEKNTGLGRKIHILRTITEK